MRFVSMVIVVACAIAGLCACSGGGASAQQRYGCFPNDPNCGKLIPVYTLMWPAGWQQPDAPLAVGASADLAFTEQRCLEPGQRGGIPPVGSCDQPYLPAKLIGTVQPMANTNAPCPLTVVQVSAGTLRFTRTGPGDPIVSNGRTGAKGYCDVTVSDPATGSGTVITL